ncbi:MAG TPA: hypothetical protein DDZ89_05535 [Clostridiales bacterium]|nr:hypothetical protein [Clostridiales bacterium]
MAKLDGNVINCDVSLIEIHSILKWAVKLICIKLIWHTSAFFERMVQQSFFSIKLIDYNNKEAETLNVAYKYY